jgi:hypothetical protein
MLHLFVYAATHIVRLRPPGARAARHHAMRMARRIGFYEGLRAARVDAAVVARALL